MAASKYHYALGRRKTATATVRLYQDKGAVQVNDKPLDEVYVGKVEQARMMAPFATLELNPKDFYFTAKVQGGGKNAQLEAIRHALARALVKIDGGYKKALKTAGFITRDPRMVERKKPGLHKARKAEQYSKR